MHTSKMVQFEKTKKVFCMNGKHFLVSYMSITVNPTQPHYIYATTQGTTVGPC